MINISEQKFQLILAVLIHEIGKLIVRAENTVGDTGYIEKGIRFFKEHLSRKRCLSGLEDTIIDIVQNPTNKALQIIELADKLQKSADKNEADPNPYLRPLRPVLSRVELFSNSAPPVSYYEPKVLDNTGIFPVLTQKAEEHIWKTNPELLHAKYRDLYKAFVDELEFIPDGNLIYLIDSLLYLFEKYLVYIPAVQSESGCDISLYDHIKTVAALATCYHEAGTDGNPFLLISADMSGIQKFIYEENAIAGVKSAPAKKLRGKSFYIGLLTDTFSSYIINELEVSRANILLNGGGHFVILVPNTPGVRDKVSKISRKIQRWFHRNFRGELFLVLETVEADDTLYKEYNKWHDLLGYKMQLAKKKKNIDILAEQFNDAEFNRSDFDYHLSEEAKEYKKNQENLNDFEEFILYRNNFFAQNIGAALPKADYLVELNFRGVQKPTWRDFNYNSAFFNEFNLAWLFINDEKGLIFLLNQLEKSGSVSARIHALNNTSLPASISTDMLRMTSTVTFPVSIGFKFLGNYTPLNAGESVMEFPELAALNYEDGTCTVMDYKLLGVLRMDVDDLGSIFSFGLKRHTHEDSIESLSRIVNLSRDFNLFFAGYLNVLAEKWGIYITYSGGDDLFVVGSWVNIIHFALNVKADLDRFSGKNPDVGISGGISMNKPSFPIGWAAMVAGDMEHAAKAGKAESGKSGKNKLAFFDTVFTWEQAVELLKYGKDLYALTQEERNGDEVSSSYIHFILTQSNEMYENDKANSGIRKEKSLEIYFRKLMQLKYSFARKPREVNHETIQHSKKEKVKQLAKLIQDPDTYLKYFVLPASYVIFKNRKTK